jgi:hypothetical protein
VRHRTFRTIRGLKVEKTALSRGYEFGQFEKLDISRG